MFYQIIYSHYKVIAKMRHLDALYTQYLDALYTQYSISFNNLIRDVAYRPEECFNGRHLPC
jgi:hypothetical protein